MDRDSSTDTSRRRFLIAGWISIVASSVLFLKGVFRYLSYSPKKDNSSPFSAGMPHNYQKGSFVQKRWFWIGRDDGGLYAIDGRCSHLGCIVRWDATERLFRCPCHGSLFDKEGDPVRGPALKSLSRASIFSGSSGEIFVDPLKKVEVGFRLRI